MRIGDNRLCLHTLSDAEDLPGKVATDIRYEKLSTDRSDCRLSFASPVGLLLSCNHIYNQYVIIDNSEENLQKFEKGIDWGYGFDAPAGSTKKSGSQFHFVLGQQF